MKSFKKYLTPEEQIKELSLTEKAWQSAKQKIAENKELSVEEQEIIDKFLGVEPAYEPDDGPLTESQVEQIQEQVQYQLVTGPQGEQGPQGIPGEKGEKGDQGEQGIPGEKGDRGERGENGLAGLKGLRGEKGDQGIQGERGEVGPQGEQGIQGVAGQDGKDGEKGDQGLQGEQGIAGRDGVDGKDGASGPKGDKGDRGEKGQDGKNGQNGKDGRDGKDGAKGDKGDRGERGEKGDKGDKGEDGETPDIKPFAEKFNKLSLDINKKVGRIASDMGALATSGGSGSYWLNDLGDTDYASIVNATDQQVLTYSEADKKWIAADSQGGGGGTLDQWARTRANAAFLQANTPSYTANSGSSYANSSFIHANAAFAYANTLTFTTDPSAGSYANSAFIHANSATILAQAAYDTANNSNTANITFDNTTMSAPDGDTLKIVVQDPNNDFNSLDLIVDDGAENVQTRVLLDREAIRFNVDLQGNNYVWTFNDVGSLTFPDTSTQNTAFTGAGVDQSARDTANSAFNKANTAITTSGGSIDGRLNVTYTPASTVGSALTISSANTQGGTSYADFLKVTNTSAGATNPNKTFRLNGEGGLEVINSDYSATVFSLSNSGTVNAGQYQVNGKQAVNGPSFSAYPTSPAQSIATASNVRVNFGNEEYDIGSCYDAPNGKFQPNVEGYYQLNATVRIDGSSGTGERMIVIYKNGTEYKRGTNESGSEAAATFFSMSVSCQSYANGSTDYFQVYVVQNSGANRTVSEYQQISYFQGCMLRGA